MPSSIPERARILVVDDEEPIVEVLSAILKRQGYETATAANGVLAVDAARSFCPHCVVSDILMPLMNGIEAAIRIKEMLPGCKVLLISGDPLATTMLDDAHARGFDFQLLSKPLHPTELLRSVAEAMERA